MKHLYYMIAYIDTSPIFSNCVFLLEKFYIEKPEYGSNNKIGILNKQRPNSKHSLIEVFPRNVLEKTRNKWFQITSDYGKEGQYLNRVTMLSYIYLHIGLLGELKEK